ncbi:MAG: SpoIIE family protein phosphatase [Thermoanaerobaculia bacterium]|nr:SpoIIE family protein phosphatase [Thermoanaerobaculia bacterium]
MKEERHGEVVIYRPSSPPARLMLTGELVTIGRSGDCTIPIKDRFLSRQHAEIAFEDQAWVLRDCDSVNGTFLNGRRLGANAHQLRAGDRIGFGDTEIVFFDTPMSGDEAITVVPDDEAPKTAPVSSHRLPTHDERIEPEPDPGKTVEKSHAETTISMRMDEIATEERAIEPDPRRLQIVSRLAMELLEDRPLDELFDFMLLRIVDLLNPSRAALAVLTPEGQDFDIVSVWPKEEKRESELRISRTLVREIVQEKKVMAFDDISQDERFGRAASIVDQNIRSALCAPLLVGDTVLGVLYLDYLMTKQSIREDDVRMAANVARIAAAKLETTRLREESMAKQRMEQELETAYLIQSRLLPEKPPEIRGYSLAARNRPCRTVSGDYFDFAMRSDGQLYFVIADVAGKGITAALIMAGMASAFELICKRNPTPAKLLTQLNEMLVPKTSPTRFVTLFAGLLDPSTGDVVYANAGHLPPIWIRPGEATNLSGANLVLGLFGDVEYEGRSFRLEPGDSLVLFTDGITEAENEEDRQLGYDPLMQDLNDCHQSSPDEIIGRIDERLRSHVSSSPLADDVTMLVLKRD